MPDKDMIVGDLKPCIGVTTRYKVVTRDGIHLQSVAWRSKVEGIYESDFEETPGDSMQVLFSNQHAGHEFIIEARYATPGGYTRLQKTVTPVFGIPQYVMSAWQDKTGSDIPNQTLDILKEVVLAIKTASIPANNQLNIEIRAKGILVKEKTAKVNTKGVAKVSISLQEWKTFKANLIRAGKSSLHESEIQYQAVVTYQTDPSKIITLQSKPLNVKYVDPRTQKELEIETAAKSAVIDAADSPTGGDANITKINLTLHVYFDGTMGNRWNIDAADSTKNLDKVIEEVGKTGREILTQNEIKMGDDATSYFQEYTNIPILHDLDNTDLDQKEIKVYIDGVGSNKYAKDNLIGAGLGIDLGIDRFDMQGAGIETKIQSAMAQIKIELEKVVAPRNNEKIAEVEVLVFGFSRGAATARYFVAHREQLAKVLGVKSAMDITYMFVGIFDTVSTVVNSKIIDPIRLIPLISPITAPKVLIDPPVDRETIRKGINNVESHRLALGSKVKKVVQITAGDEYRLFFPLTTIASSISAGVGFELELPGSHCDVGGGDLDNIKESIELTENVTHQISHSPGYKPEYISRFIQKGWYKEEDLMVKETVMYKPQDDFYDPGGRHVFRKYTLERTVSNRFRTIPVSIMMHFAEKYGDVSFKIDKLPEKYSIPNELKPLGDELLQFAIQEDAKGARRTSALGILQKNEYKNIRNRYLHLSASPDSGKSDMVATIKDPANIEGGSERHFFEG